MKTLATTLAVAAVVFAVPTAMAQVVKCVGADGKTEYRNGPCPGAATGRTLPPVGASPSPAAAGPARGPSGAPSKDGVPTPEQALLCPPLQASVKALYADNERWRRGVRNQDPLVSATGGPAGGMNVGLQADMNIGRNNAQIADIMRRSEEMGCRKVGLYAGPTDAQRAMDNARHCQKLADDYVWRRDAGEPKPMFQNGRQIEVPNQLRSIEDQLRQFGCDIPR